MNSDTLHTPAGTQKILEIVTELSKESTAAREEIRKWAQDFLGIEQDRDAKEDIAAAAAGFKTPLMCPVCGQRGHIEFTSRGTTFVSCSQHRLQALMLGASLSKVLK